MPDFEFSAHTKEMLKERNLAEEWVWRTLDAPDKKWRGDDGNVHYTKRIHERDGRVLRVVVNADVQPNRVVTVFFDRRLRQKTESTQ
ncbi:MAG: DUF4258 domain-containing protein [Caldilinea sp.]|uniref:DUF4258 domain-containing protein n=1 Tax=Caldilinea sp. TaxID=2293560 RepID=UPI002C85B9CC|nr:DUF4258 domain-containing protein [Anaerolineales bacterium]HQY95144.1 DUF4258 domain-containing protein [Caldilinea sp.]HRA66932.1 DUF4258 domain-containing protein [Caldilinea sp.]